MKLNFKRYVGVVASARCNLGIRDDLLHLVVQCPDTDEIKCEMFEVISAIDDDYVTDILTAPQEVFYVLMGKQPATDCFDSIVKIWLVSSKYLSMI